MTPRVALRSRSNERADAKPAGRSQGRLRSYRAALSVVRRLEQLDDVAGGSFTGNFLPPRRGGVSLAVRASVAGRAWVSKQDSNRIAGSQRGSARRPTPAELDRADLQVAAARERADRFAKQVDDDMRRGNPTTHSRQLLKTFQQILREMVAHRDAVFAEYMKGRPEPQVVEKVVTILACGGVIAECRIAIDGPFETKAFVERALQMADAQGLLDGAGPGECTFSIDGK